MSENDTPEELLAAPGSHQPEFHGQAEEHNSDDLFSPTPTQSTPTPAFTSLPTSAPTSRTVNQEAQFSPAAVSPEEPQAPKNLRKFWEDLPLPKGAPKISPVLTLNPQARVDPNLAHVRPPSLAEQVKEDLSRLENADDLLSEGPELPQSIRALSLFEAEEAGELFPTPGQLKQAVALSVCTALLGFGMSYALFVKKEIATNVPKVDRQAAEKPPPIAYRSEAGSEIFFSGYSGGLMEAEPEGKGPDLTLRAPKIDPSPKASATTTPQVRAVVAAQVDSQGNYPGTAAHTHHTTKPKGVESPQSSRPDHKGWVRAWSEARAACVTFSTRDGPGLGGVIVSADGKCLTCLSKANPELLSRVVTSAGITSGQIVGRDPDHDIAVVQLSGSQFPFIPISPDGPGAGEWFVTPNALDPNRNWQQQCLGSVSGGVFRIRGASLYNSAGWPLINDRAEVVAVSIGKPYIFDMHNSAAVSASGLASLLTSPGSNGVPRTCNDYFESMFGGLRTTGDRTRPTTANNKAVPGEALGNYPLGMSRTQVVAELGSPSGQDQVGSLSRLAFPTHHLVAYLAKDQVVSWETDNTFYSYGRGISPGGTLDNGKFQSEFPGAIWYDNGGHTLGLANGMEVECNGGKITKLRVVVR